MYKILRSWNINDYSTLEKFNELLYKRPRVDYRISEYVFQFINENVLGKYNIIHNKNYQVELSFHNSEFYPQISHKEKYLFDFDDEKGYTYGAYDNINWDKLIIIDCYSKLLNETIKPVEYANIVYDMIIAYLINKCKKITRESTHKNQKNMDYKIIENFTFPALFDNQKYIHDDPIDGSFFIDGEKKINIKKEYIKKYNE